MSKLMRSVSRSGLGLVLALLMGLAVQETTTGAARAAGTTASACRDAGSKAGCAARTAAQSNAAPRHAQPRAD